MKRRQNRSNEARTELAMEAASTVLDESLR